MAHSGPVTAVDLALGSNRLHFEKVAMQMRWRYIGQCKNSRGTVAAVVLVRERFGSVEGLTVNCATSQCVTCAMNYKLTACVQLQQGTIAVIVSTRMCMEAKMGTVCGVGVLEDLHCTVQQCVNIAKINLGNERSS